MCILSPTLLKVVGYYDLSVLSMSVMGFHNNSLDGVSSLQVFLGIFLNFAKPLTWYGHIKRREDGTC